MSSSTLFRLSGLAAILGGVLLPTSWILRFVFSTNSPYPSLIAGASAFSDSITYLVSTPLYSAEPSVSIRRAESRRSPIFPLPISTSTNQA